MTFFPDIETTRKSWFEDMIDGLREWWCKWVWDKPRFQKYVFPILRKTYPNLKLDEVVAEQPMTAPIEGVFDYQYQYGGKTMGKTEMMLEQALDNIEIVREWPYVIVARTWQNVERMGRRLCEKAKKRGLKKVKWNKNRGIVTIGAGPHEAKYMFIIGSGSDKPWGRGYSYFTDVVEDNECQQVFRKEYDECWPIHVDKR